MKIDPRIIDTLVEHAKSGEIGRATERVTEKRDDAEEAEDENPDAVEAASES